jgi:prepilin-type N-terminal cleavage/methylation domain-containing protein
VKKSGFTLAELLIALGILGVIATFTIPKILTSQASSRKTAVFRETFAAFSEAYYTGWMQGQVNESNVATYLRSHINAVKVCNNALTEQCWTHTAAIPSYLNSAGFIMANGATVAGMDDAGTVGYDAFIIDWNGPQAPNVEGDDQVVVKIILDPSQGKAGTIESYASRAASKTLFEQIFQS